MFLWPVTSDGAGRWAGRTTPGRTSGGGPRRTCRRRRPNWTEDSAEPGRMLAAEVPPAGGSKYLAESGAERLAHLLTLGLPPLVQDGDVGADREVPDAHVEEVLRLIRGGELGARRHAHLDGRFEHAALYHS